MAGLASQLRWPENVWMGVSIENQRWARRTDYLRRVPAAVRSISAEPLLGPLDGLDLAGIHWLIAGGESGRGHRPVRAEWLRDLRDACHNAGVAIFFKQWGGPRSIIRRSQAGRQGVLGNARCARAGSSRLTNPGSARCIAMQGVDGSVHEVAASAIRATRFYLPT